MVYTGKPSQGCFACRKKRRRCDKLRPSCTQCVRAQVECWGYRDPRQVVFRDVTASVANKSRRQRTDSTFTFDHKASLPDVDSSNADGPTIRRAKAKIDQAGMNGLHRNMAPTLYADDVAANFFLSFYLPESAFPYFKNIIGTSVMSTESSAFRSAALAVLSQQLKMPPLLKFARKLYAEAIKDMNDALTNADQASEDSTLASILLLGLFEGQVYQGRDSPTEWVAHAYGAATVLELRGEKQFDTQVGKELFMYAALNIRMTCILRKVPVPSAISRLHEYAMSNMEIIDPRWAAGPILDETAQFSHDLTLVDLEPVQVDKVMDLIERGIILDAAHANLLESFAVNWPPETLSEVNAPEYAYDPRSVHWYPGQRFARNYNFIRMFRMFVNSWICDAVIALQLAAEDPLYICSDPIATTYEAALQNLEDTTTDVLSSVPFFLRPSTLTLTATHVIWPLTCIAMSTYAHGSARAYALTILKRLQADFIHQADFATEIAEDPIYEKPCPLSSFAEHG